MAFDSKGSGSSRIGGVETGENIKVEALDKVLTEKKVTFVKMDIEGAEQEALYGMKDIIKKQKQSPPPYSSSQYYIVQHLIFLIHSHGFPTPDILLYQLQNSNIFQNLK